MTSVPTRLVKFPYNLNLEESKLQAPSILNVSEHPDLDNLNQSIKSEYASQYRHSRSMSVPDITDQIFKKIFNSPDKNGPN